MASNSEWMSAPHSTGTTIVAAEFKDGVVVGADSRSTTGAYVANRVTQKLEQITETIFCCRAGSSADTQAIVDMVKLELSLHSLELGGEPLVETAAAVFTKICYTNRDTLNAGFLIAGWDKKKGGQVYSVQTGGMCVRQAVSAGGSGSTYVYGYIEANYKDGMTKKICTDFVTKTIALAMSLDGSSGGVVNIGVITEEGIERHLITEEDLPKFYSDESRRFR